MLPPSLPFHPSLPGWKGNQQNRDYTPTIGGCSCELMIWVRRPDGGRMREAEDSADEGGHEPVGPCGGYWAFTHGEDQTDA